MNAKLSLCLFLMLGSSFCACVPTHVYPMSSQPRQAKQLASVQGLTFEGHETQILAAGAR